MRGAFGLVLERAVARRLAERKKHPTFAVRGRPASKSQDEILILKESRGLKAMPASNDRAVDVATTEYLRAYRIVQSAILGKMLQSSGASASAVAPAYTYIIYLSVRGRASNKRTSAQALE
ncbi:hypothetical protein HYFRA_00001188 [Hymenoscyphus fraxineus]|uniref:Uncharacterized protein n=1 Tax=Hymenoscyphus fraxineus TaxID=746836 RepID=A0A9N9KSR8_9HELO|nr:hypothetical protein HYFRA_00001188 [Hymenoscyphus fraxineus]